MKKEHMLAIGIIPHARHSESSWTTRGEVPRGLGDRGANPELSGRHLLTDSEQMDVKEPVLHEASGGSNKALSSPAAHMEVHRAGGGRGHTDSDMKVTPPRADREDNSTPRCTS